VLPSDTLSNTANSVFEPEIKHSDVSLASDKEPPPLSSVSWLLPTMCLQRKANLLRQYNEAVSRIRASGNSLPWCWLHGNEGHEYQPEPHSSSTCHSLNARPDRSCYACQRKGHLIADCPQPTGQMGTCQLCTSVVTFPCKCYTDPQTWK
jgi:hypothetical protein